MEMQKSHRTKAIRYVQNTIASHEAAIADLRADLQVLENDPPALPTWRASVWSAWASEGEPSWDGTLQAPDVRQAVYQAMLAFCKNAGRIYPGKDSWDHFDVQGTVCVTLLLPNGTTVPVDRNRLDALKGEFNRKAPLPPKPKRRQSEGLT